MKQDDLNTDMTAQGLANRLGLRLADRYPMGSVRVDATRDGKQVKVTLTDPDGDSEEQSFDVDKLVLIEDPLLEVLPRLKTPDDVAKGKIIREPTDEAAARAVATDADMPEDVIVTKPEADNIDSDEVTVASAEAVTPRVNGVPVVVSSPNNAEQADPETARAAAIEQASRRAELAGGMSVTINKQEAVPVPEASDAAVRAAAEGNAASGAGDVSLGDLNADAADTAETRTRVRADADTTSASTDKAKDAAKAATDAANKTKAK